MLHCEKKEEKFLSDKIKNVLLCPLFKDVQLNEILEMNYIIKKYNKDEIIALEGDFCNSIGIVLEGIVEIKKYSTSGKSFSLKTLKTGDVFGEGLIFSDFNKYPSTVVAASNCFIFFLNKQDILTLCHIHSVFLNNFMKELSNRIVYLNRKINELSLNTLRDKIINFIYEEYKKQKSLEINMSTTKQQLAEKFNVQRPSLSRELIRLKDEGIIDFTKNKIVVLDINAIEDYLYSRG